MSLGIEEGGNGSSGRILVVDDSEPNLILLRSLLLLEGYRVTAARNGLEALEAALAEPPDLVLLDVLMPEMSGYEVCQRLKAHPSTSDVPIIFVTAKGEVNERVIGLEVGADDYISKPYHPDELRARVKAALRTKTARDRLRQEREEMAAQAITDSLTGAFNRRFLNARLDEEVERARRYGGELACLMLDLDYFKTVNDRFGHATGDLVLRDFVDQVRQCLRSSDLLARYGGEEFTIVATGTGLQGALTTAEKLRRFVQDQEFRTVRGERLRLTTSVGVASLRLEETSETLLARADQALYEAKRQGRNRVVVAP